MALSYKHRIQISCNYVKSPPTIQWKTNPLPPSPPPKKKTLAKSIQSNQKAPYQNHHTTGSRCASTNPPALRKPRPSVRWSHGVVPRPRKQSLRGWSWVMLLVVGWVISSVRGFLFFGRIFPEVLGGDDFFDMSFLDCWWGGFPYGFFRGNLFEGLVGDFLLMSWLLLFFVGRIQVLGIFGWDLWFLGDSTWTCWRRWIISASSLLLENVNCRGADGNPMIKHKLYI